VKDGNITVSVCMAKAGALTRLSGWKTEGLCRNAQHGQEGFSSLQHPRLALGRTQPPIHWVLGDLVLVVCGQA
jgi:hypothetical protein